jgi:hypothetical protein
MRDIKCLVLRMKKLNVEPIIKVTKQAEIRLMGDRGAFRVHFPDYSMGYFKPCPPFPEYPGVDEDWQSELIAFHLSVLLGFNRY